jgi:DNA-binding NarL/FixJ family response regulator
LQSDTFGALNTQREGKRPRLTERQIQVLALVVGGYSNKAIAAAGNVNESTVKRHVSSLLRAYGVTNALGSFARLSDG